MTQQINDGGPAYPVNELDQHTGGVFAQHMGMPLRDWFAGQAMAGDCATGDGCSLSISDEGLLNAAKLYYRMADAMLIARATQ